jgi:superfamily II DNA or RNA helicase
MSRTASSAANLGVDGSTINLDPEQVNVLRGIYAQLQADNKSMYIEAPTGFGKTVIILKLLEIITRDGRPPRIFIAVPDIDTMNVWRDAINDLKPVLATAGSDLFDNIGYYYEDQKDTDKAITIGTMTSLVLTNQQDIFGNNDFSLIIVDEGHKALSDLRKSILAKSGAIRVYLSATPAYTKLKGLGSVATCAFRCSQATAEDRRLISRYTNIVIAQPNVTLDDSALNARGGLDAKEMARRARLAAVNKQMIDFYLSEKQPHNQQPFFGTQGIVNCFNIEDSVDTAAEINAALEGRLPSGVQAAASIHSRLGGNERKALKQGYKDGKILILTGVGLLTHSFHSWRTTFVWNKKPSSSGVEVGQRGGRGRSMPRGMEAVMEAMTGPKMAYIIDVLYRNASYKAWQILYGEWVSGFLEDDEASKRPVPLVPIEKKKPGVPQPEIDHRIDISLLPAGTVISDPEQVKKLYAERARLLADLRPAPGWSIRFPYVWEMAKRRGFFSVTQMGVTLGAMGETGHNPSKILNVLRGVVKFYDPEFLEWHPTCLALSRLLQRHVCDLFPVKNLGLPKKPNPEALRRRKNREAFLSLLRENGYESLGAFGKAHGLSPSRMNTVSGNGADNFSAQGWIADAIKTADALGLSPEQVFGTPADIRDTHASITLAALSGHTDTDISAFFPNRPPDLTEDLHARLQTEAIRDTIDASVQGGALTEREAKVLHQRFGVCGEVEMTLDEVGAENGKVSRERIRQIEARALRILKHPARCGRLRRYWEDLGS